MWRAIELSLSGVLAVGLKLYPLVITFPVLSEMRPMLYVLLTMINLAKVICMPDFMCFNEETDPVKSLSGRTVIEKTEKETARACEVACGDNDQCKYIAYIDPYCYFLGEPTDDAGCSNPVTVRVKGDCITRLNITAEFGKDKCTSEIFDVATTKDRQGICPRDDRMMVIRAINETGARVTFDNDVTNMLVFDFNRNLWRFNNPDSGFSSWLVAVSCVTTIDTYNCGCNPLPQMDPGRFGFTGPVDAYVGPTGACEDRRHQLTYWGARFGPNADYGNLSPDQAVKAGIWILTKEDNSNGFQIVNATCSQMPM